MQIKPLLRKILTHPDLFASIDEPNMLKTPVVYAVGVMRALGLGITDSTVADYLGAMGQTPYFPPNVSGWEGGLSWLNTNTALARWGFVAQLITSGPKIADVVGETTQAAYDRAYLAVGSPWLAPGTTRSDPRRSDAHAIQDAHPAPAAPAGAPHPDARRSRRPGDVMSEETQDTSLQP